MTPRQFLTASALGFGLAVASAASAHGVGGFVCQTFNMVKNLPATTHCVTWTREAKAMIQAAGCNPSKMTADEMRRRCAEMSARSSPSTPLTNG